MKLVLDEPGTANARDLYTGTVSIQSSRLLGPEAYSAIGRATEQRGFTAAGRTRAFALLRALLDEVRAVELDEPVADRASELAATFHLRGADAVHLASFERVEAGAAVLVAADGDLVRVARSLGHAVAVPG